jgi:16S rRNA processing protein RimM
VPDRPDSTHLVVVGIVRRPVGLKGELVVGPTGNDPDRFAPGIRLVVGTRPAHEAGIVRSRPYGNGVALFLEGVDSIEKAEALRGVELSVTIESLPKLPEGSYYHYQVIGLTVVDSAGVVLGRIDSIIETGSNDVYCVRQGLEEILIPAVKDFVERVDLENGRLCLKVPRASLGESEDPI